jgi:predicted nucleic acid-binding protein
MVVVADSSPIIVLMKIGHIQILPALFATVIIPPQIAAELSDGKRPQPVRDLIASKPDWLQVHAPAVIEPIPELHEGEQAAISLATELQAGLLLIDEMVGRDAALARKLIVTGTIGILERAAKRGFLDLNNAFGLLRKTNFWISATFLDDRLEKFRQWQRLAEQ